MALRIRLRRVGRKGQPAYRIVVADSRSPRDGRFVETLGVYHPRAKDQQIDVDVQKARAWLEKGARPSETVASILRKIGCFAAPSAPASGA